VRFEVLGPVCVRRGGEVVTVSGTLRRGLLAMLLAQANRPVSVDTLRDNLWGEPPGARDAQRLQLLVHRLRGLLDDPERLSFGPGGYGLRVLPGELDADQFGELLQEASGLAAHDPHRCAQMIRTALSLWRGTPYQDVDVPYLAGEIQRLSECRLVAVEDLYSAECRGGRHGAITGELSSLVHQYPLRERLHGLLMTALYRSGRQADALAAYRQAREILGDELGLEPGPELRALEQRILTGKPIELTPPARPAVVPAQLPHNVSGFVGREAELSRLDRMLAEGGESVLISAVAGTAGVGKTALAVRWAHRVKARFPDGQLYVDLRGYGPDRPSSPGDVLAGFLRALGMDATAIPQELSERAARFRTLVDQKRLLVVLDNARSADQVRPLVPGTPRSFVVVTSRDSLAGLAARDGAQRIDLDRMTTDEAQRLLKELLGDQDGAQELIERCARLPLALRIAAERVRERPHRRISELIAELADEQAQLDLLDSGDPHGSVRAVFSASYRHLEPEAARLFRLLGLHPSHDVDAYALTALLGSGDLRTTRQWLETLVRAHLVEETTGHRYHLHDLLRAYAAELSATTDTAIERRKALTRLLDYYVYTASVAANFIAPGGPVPQNRSGVTAPPLSGYETAVRWLDAERVNLILVSEWAATSDLAGYTTDLATALAWYLDFGWYLDDAQGLYAKALVIARERGDVIAEGTALRALGLVQYRLGRFPEAQRYFEDALALNGDADIQAGALACLGALHEFAGSTDDAIDCLHQASALLLAAGRRLLAQWPLLNLGSLYRRRGDYETALACLHKGFTVAHESNYPPGQAHAAYCLAGLHRDAGRHADALDYAHRALTFARKASFPFFEGLVMNRLGTVYLRLGEYDKAQRHYRETLAIAKTTSNPKLEAMALNGSAETYAAAGAPAEATRCHNDALTLAPARGTQYEQARAHAGLGDINDRLSDREKAIEHWRQALDIYRDLQAPEATGIQEKLARST
jgi:DNA-binding SARP family transcriptional activator/Flp pilus assembly protein TadD